MFASSGPPATLTEPAAPWYVERIEYRVFDGPASVAPSPAEREFLAEYVADLVRPYGYGLRESVLADGTAHRYEEMTEELIATVVAPGPPVDLVVLAFGVPDVRAGRTTATYRPGAVGGDPLAFAVCDQGCAAAFTGLRLVDALARTRDRGSSLLLLPEQPVLAYEPSVPAALPDQPAVVAIRCGQTGSVRYVGGRTRAGVAAPGLAAQLEAELVDLCAGAGPVTLVIGEGLADRNFPHVSTVDAVRAVRPGQPYTGVWRELATALAEPTDAGRWWVVADYDAALGYLCLAAFESVVS